MAAHRKGCKFDGWSDKFRLSLWREAFAEVGIDPDFYTTRSRQTNEVFPWDHIDTRVSKEFLKKEWARALAEEHTPDCRTHPCNACGVCDFYEIEPIVHIAPDHSVLDAPTILPDNEEEKYRKVMIIYSKRGQARFFGHLELVNIFLRAIRRAGIAVKFSSGFHPMPKVSFEDPLPIGMESQSEAMYLSVSESFSAHSIVSGLNRNLPDGLHVWKCRAAPLQGGKAQAKLVKYQVGLREGGFQKEKLINFLRRSACVITRKSPKGKEKSLDLKEIVQGMSLRSPDLLEMTLKTESGRSVRPAEVIKAVFGLSEDAVKRASVVKIKQAFV
jgi:radical SAM-linked protein